MNPIFADLPTTIFEKMSSRARALGAINLGQGFPDGQGPADVLEAASRALFERSNQYPSMLGLPELRRAIGDHYVRHQGLVFDPDSEITVTSGATEALAAAILGLVSPGDEVVLIQPMYDAYLPLVRQAGGVPRFVTLQPPEWKLTEAVLAAAFTERTKLIIVNSPLNPTATVLDERELALIADYCVRHDAIAICDEVWEHIIFDGVVHRPLIGCPGMRERAVKIGSGGKILALTGWKVGWLCAAPRLMHAIARAHQFLCYTTAPNLQIGVAHGLAKPDGWFADMRAGLARSRDRLSCALREAGYAVLPSAGTYFLSIDLAASGIALDDESFCDRLIEKAGVAAIPVSAFYTSNVVRTTARLCFAKQDATLDEAAARLAQARDLFD